MKPTRIGGQRQIKEACRGAVKGLLGPPVHGLIGGLATAFENGRLKIAKGLPLAGALMGELRAFKVRFTAKGRDTYAGRSGEHDDLVMAVALAAWFAVARCWRGPRKEPPGHQGRAPI